MANKKGLTDFKASMTWVQKFMDRNGFTIRRKTTQSQRLPPELSKKVSNFFFYLNIFFQSEKKKMKSALECNPHSNVIRNFWEKKKRNPRIVFELIRYVGMVCMDNLQAKPTNPDQKKLHWKTRDPEAEMSIMQNWGRYSQIRHKSKI